MGSDKKYQKLSNEVDSYLGSLTFDNLIALRPGAIYSILYTNLSKLTVKYYDGIDATHNIEISVRKEYELEFVELTGYIKLIDKFIWIDNRYSRREVGVDV